MKNSAVLTISSFMLYILKSLIRGILAGTFNINESVAEIFSILFVLTTVFFMIRKKETLLYYGICKWEDDDFYKMYAFLLLIPLVNLPYLFSGAKINIVLAIISSVFIGIMEELIFRSFLCRSVEGMYDKDKVIIISSVIFGLFHLLNIGNYPLIYVLLQVVYAFAVGIAFSVVFYKSKSILPCIIIHIAVDFLGSFELEPIFVAEIIGTIICSLCAVYSYFFLTKK